MKLLAKPSYYKEYESERLKMRPLTIEDAKHWEEWIMDSIATKEFPDDFKGSPDKAVLWMNRNLDRYKENRFGFLAILEKETNKFVGLCGLLVHEINGVDELEVGYSFIRRFWGNGYAPEAAKMFMEIGFKEYNVDSIISLITPTNLNSQRVAEKNGLVKGAMVKHHGMDLYVFRIMNYY